MKEHIINPINYKNKTEHLKKRLLEMRKQNPIFITGIDKCKWKTISNNKEYVVHRYLYQNNMLKCNRKFEDFEDVKLIKESAGFFHFIAKCNTIFTATLKNN